MPRFSTGWPRRVSARLVFVTWLLVLLAILAGGALLAARTGLLTPGEAALRDTYALPASQFVDLDGQQLHYTDQGRGPAVVLLHGSFGNLRDWQDWVTVLAGDYRVVRLDLPRLGLSGPDPAGDSSVVRREQLLEALREHLGLERFVLVATSSSGEVAAAYAADYPARVAGLILANIAAGPMAMNRSHLPWRLRALLRVDPWFAGWHPRAYWREILQLNFARPERVSDAMVSAWTDLNNRAQRLAPVSRPADAPVPFARTPGDLARIQAPTLLLWSAEDAELPVDTVGRRALELLAAPEKQLVIVPDCGHLMPLECGPQSAALAKAFLRSLGSDLWGQSQNLWGQSKNRALPLAD